MIWMRKKQKIVVLALLCLFGWSTSCGSDGSNSDDINTDNIIDTDGVMEPDGGCNPLKCTKNTNIQSRDDFDFVVVQNFTTPDGSVDLSMAWHIGEGETVGETLPYEMLRFGICEGSGGICISNPADMTYEWRHHNWDETITATTASKQYTIRMRLVLSDYSEWEDTVTITNTDDSNKNIGPIVLEEAGCRTVPENNANACILRERLDD